MTERPAGPLFPNPLHTHGEAGIGQYWFVSDATLISLDNTTAERGVPGYMAIWGHELGHRFSMLRPGALSPGSPYEVLRELAGISHVLLRALGAVRYPESQCATQVVNALFRRVQAIERVIDAAWRQLEPHAELAAAVYTPVTDEPAQSESATDTAAGQRPCGRGRIERIVADITRAYPSIPIQDAWNALARVPDYALRQRIVDLCLACAFLRTHEQGSLLSPTRAVDALVKNHPIPSNLVDPVTLIPDTAERALHDQAFAASMDRLFMEYCQGNLAVVEYMEHLSADISPIFQPTRNLVRIMRRCIRAVITTPEVHARAYPGDKAEFLTKKMLTPFLQFRLGESGRPIADLNPQFILAADREEIGIPSSSEWWLELLLMEQLRSSATTGETSFCPFKDWTLYMNENHLWCPVNCPFKKSFSDNNVCSRHRSGH